MLNSYTSVLQNSTHGNSNIEIRQRSRGRRQAEKSANGKKYTVGTTNVNVATREVLVC